MRCSQVSKIIKRPTKDNPLSICLPLFGMHVQWGKYLKLFNYNITCIKDTLINFFFTINF